MGTTASSPIVVLDSGLGGLTVARAIRRAMPQEDIVYFGDTARLPYGSKTAATVQLFVRQIISYLRPFTPKHVVIACNTATALALPELRQEFADLTISGVIEPGARAAVEAAGARQMPVIGIIATEATIRSGAYERAIIRRRSRARMVMLPTPLLVPIIEEGRDPSDPLVHLALQQYLTPMLQRGIQVLLLGCTHYPLLKPAIEQVVGPEVSVIDSADKCAEDVARRLATRGLIKTPDGSIGTLQCFVTDDSPRFGMLASRFLGMPVAAPRWVSPDELLGGGVVTLRAGLRPAV